MTRRTRRRRTRQEEAEEEEEQEEEQEEQEEEEEATDIKSNNPHLAGGETCLFVPICLGHLLTTLWVLGGSTVMAVK